MGYEERRRLGDVSNTVFCGFLLKPCHIVTLAWYSSETVPPTIS